MEPIEIKYRFGMRCNRKLVRELLAHCYLLKTAGLRRERSALQGELWPTRKRNRLKHKEATVALRESVARG